MLFESFFDLHLCPAGVFATVTFGVLVHQHLRPTAATGLAAIHRFGNLLPTLVLCKAANAGRIFGINSLSNPSQKAAYSARPTALRLCNMRCRGPLGWVSAKRSLLARANYSIGVWG